MEGYCVLVYVSCWCWRVVFMFRAGLTLGVIYYTLLLFWSIFLPLSSSPLSSLPFPILFSSHSFSSVLPSSLIYSLLPNPSFPLLFLIPFHSIRVGTSIHLFIFNQSPTFWPRMFYRSGWLRCDVFNYVLVFRFCWYSCVLVFLRYLKAIVWSV